jgi:hypothetical protein
MQKILMKFALLIGIIGFSSCGKLPVSPEIESGILITEANEVYYVNNQTGEDREIPVLMGCTINPALDKAILHSNKDWNKVLLYIRLLERAVPRNIKKELIKLRKSMKILDTRKDLYGL